MRPSNTRFLDKGAYTHAEVSTDKVPAPFARKFEREDTQLELNGIEIITTPVIINPPPQ
jgi:hypothetical protein